MPKGTHDEDNQIYIKAVKKRLLNAVQKRYDNDVNLNKLLTDIHAQNLVYISYNTLNATIDENNVSSLNALAVIGICKVLNLNIAAVLAPPNSIVPVEILDDFDVTKAFVPLNDEHYFGDFYGYMYSPKLLSNNIHKFTLNINQDSSKLRITVPFKNSKGIDSESVTELFGKPVLARSQNIVYINFSNEFGNCYNISFSYVNYKNQPLYFRRGSIQTQGVDSAFSPMIQNFVMFRDELPPENEWIIPGLLLMYTDCFKIKKSSLEKLKDNEYVSVLWNKYQHLIEHQTEETYEINEAQIMADKDFKCNPTPFMYALQILKGEAEDPTKIYYENNGYYAEFSKIAHIVNSEDAQQM